MLYSCFLALAERANIKGLANEAEGVKILSSSNCQLGRVLHCTQGSQQLHDL